MHLRFSTIILVIPSTKLTRWPSSLPGCSSVYLLSVCLPLHDFRPPYTGAFSTPLHPFLTLLLFSFSLLPRPLTLERHPLPSPPEEPHVFGQPGGVNAWQFCLRHGSWSLDLLDLTAVPTEALLLFLPIPSLWRLWRICFEF